MKKYEWLEEETLDEDIPINLSSYYKRIKDDPHWLSKVLDNWSSVESYVNTLYVLKFVKRMTNAELRKYTNHLGFPDLYKRLGWYYNSFDLMECEQLYNQELTRLQGVLEEYSIDNYRNNPGIKNQYERSINSKQRLKDATTKRFDVKSIEELFYLLHYLSKVKDLTTGEIALLYGCSTDYVADLLNKCHLNENRLEARRKIIRNNRGNYTQATISRKKKNSLESIEQGVTGSNLEVVLRRVIDSLLGTYLDINEYICLVCLSTTSIITPMEIDIPIIILNKLNTSYYMYAVELDGEIWHSTDNTEINSDQKKENLIKETDWKLIRIRLSSESSSKSSRIKSIIESAANEICQIIQNDITNGSEKWITKSLYI